MVLGLPEPYDVGVKVIQVDLKDRHCWRADGEQTSDCHSFRAAPEPPKFPLDRTPTY